MMLEGEPKERRDRLLRAWADDLDQKGFTDLQINLEIFPTKPEGFGDMVPDIVARRKDGRRLVGEIWMCESVDRDHGMFSRAMNYAYNGDVVMLLVPFDCMEEAEELVRQWGLEGEIFIQGIFD